jgi:hypothetical protein
MPQPHFRQGFASMYPILRSTAHLRCVYAGGFRNCQQSQRSLRRAAVHWSPYAAVPARPRGAVLDFRILKSNWILDCARKNWN